VADSQKENRQEKGGVETVSEIDEKRKFLLDELSELMEQTSGDYGPLIMEELQQRLEFVIQNFNDELKELIKSSFETWKIKDSQLRDLMENNIDNLQVSKSQEVKENPVDSSIPDFIKDVEFGPIRRK
tara:strand:+ start:419 stop:802 length:384 start_codon:yes stop_codon:yes gene_type:complete